MVSPGGGTARVHVPATSANLGPGFDALGLALSLGDDVTASVTTAGLHVQVSDEAAQPSAPVPRDESNLVVRSMRAAFEKLGGQPAGLRLACINRIPHGRGLGSSAAAIVAGLLLARELVDGGRAQLPDAQVLVLAAQLEGHPDNVAACLLGGLTVAWTEPGGACAVRVPTAATLRPVLLVPPFASSTSQARGVLPAVVPHADATVNAGRVALLLAALAHHPEHLLPATQDLLHQPYRAPAMPATAQLVERLRSAGLPAVVSGAGPTVLVLARSDAEAAQATEQTPAGWAAITSTVSLDGAEATRSP